jgi:hypothetical protein
MISEIIFFEATLALPGGTSFLSWNFFFIKKIICKKNLNLVFAQKQTSDKLGEEE